jgi:glyoxylase-like metal-dependent hydrolase (beta-lactamase superfamily II)
MIDKHDISDRPDPGVAVRLEPGLLRILAPNPSPMTHWGTNTYIVGGATCVIIDPGPDDPDHLSAILEAVATSTVTHILITHAHRDHSLLAPRLSAATGAPVCGFGPPTAGRTATMQDLARTSSIGGGEGVDHGFQPDMSLTDGQELVWNGSTMTAIWTPGHFSGHLTFQWNDRMFTGDHVMEWASTLISPPDGDVTAFMASCTKLLGRRAARLYPGHGAPVLDPAARIDWLIRHRQDREAQILAALGPTPLGLGALTRQIYQDAPLALIPAAERNVLAHLIDLEARNLVRATPGLNPTAKFIRL